MFMTTGHDNGQDSKTTHNPRMFVLTKRKGGLTNNKKGTIFYATSKVRYSQIFVFHKNELPKAISFGLLNNIIVSYKIFIKTIRTNTSQSCMIFV